MSVVQLRHCSTEAVSQSTVSEFLLIYKSDPIIIPFNVFEQFFLKQLGVSSVKELIDKTLVAREALKAAPLPIPLRYRPELFHKQLYSHVEILFMLLFIIVTLSISFSSRPKHRRNKLFRSVHI